MDCSLHLAQLVPRAAVVGRVNNPPSGQCRVRPRVIDEFKACSSAADTYSRHVCAAGIEWKPNSTANRPAGYADVSKARAAP